MASGKTTHRISKSRKGFSPRLRSKKNGMAGSERSANCFRSQKKMPYSGSIPARLQPVNKDQIGWVPGPGPI